jgi:hypothetical protein
MKTRDLVRIGIPAGRCAEAAKQILQKAHTAQRQHGCRKAASTEAGQEEMFTRVPMAHKDIDKVMAV